MSNVIGDEFAQQKIIGILVNAASLAISSLTGTTWVINSAPTLLPSSVTWQIEFDDASEDSHNTFSISSYDIEYDFSSVYDGSNWTNNDYKTITFLSEVDENGSGTQEELIEWLMNNAVRSSSNSSGGGNSGGNSGGNYTPETLEYYIVTNYEIASIANAIRQRAGIQEHLEWPGDFVDAIEGI
jgi:hypothetical protein